MTCLRLFWTFFKIGAFTFGGGYAMLPLIQAEVLKNGWLSEPEMINFIAVSESTPGPFAINIATYIGIRSAGLPGAIFATVGVILPSFIIILIVARFFLKFKENRIVGGCMSGLKPAVIGMIAAALLNMAMTVFFPIGFQTTVFHTLSFWISLIIFAVMTVLALKKVHPIIIIVASAILGILAGYFIL